MLKSKIRYDEQSINLTLSVVYMYNVLIKLISQLQNDSEEANIIFKRNKCLIVVNLKSFSV